MSLTAAPLISSRLNCSQGQKGPSCGPTLWDFQDRVTCRHNSNTAFRGRMQGDKRRPTLHSVSKAAISTACLLVQLVTILIVCQYDTSHSEWRENEVQ